MDGVFEERQKNMLSRYGEKYCQIGNIDDSESLRYLLRELLISKKSHNHNNDDWITIDNHSHIKLILENYGDSDKRKILTLISETPVPITKIPHICNMPQTSAYRKFTSLIQNGLIVRGGLISSHGRNLVIYKPVFEKIQIDIIKNRSTLKVILTKN
ncbi:MAG TPA: hypothetical protein VFG24_04115 [Nitrosopumilaceae archaeon]|nr:hypothetical protein [Nitrosopumilaceae archaeon]